MPREPQFRRRQDGSDELVAARRQVGIPGSPPRARIRAAVAGTPLPFAQPGEDAGEYLVQQRHPVGVQYVFVGGQVRNREP